VDPESILVVDEDRDVASTVGEYLTREGHTVILAHSGRDGLTRLREGAVALLLVDLRPPDMDGIEVMHAAQRVPNPPDQKEGTTKLYGITAHLATTLDLDSVLTRSWPRPSTSWAATPPLSTSTTRRAGASWFAADATWIPPSR